MTPQHTGPRLRRERDERGLSRLELARLILAALPEDDHQRPSAQDMATTYIKRWEAGKVGVSNRYQRAYAAAFNMDRRSLFGTPSTAPLNLITGGHFGGKPRNPGTYASQVREANRHLIALDSRFGGTGIAMVATQAFRAAQNAVATGRHDSDTADLQAAAGETGEIAAWCLYDADRLEDSRAITHEAMMLSRLAGDRSMELFQFSHLALVDLHQRRSREALQIAESVICENSSPRVAALFRIRAARALAQSGDRRRALDTLAEALGSLLESLNSRDPHWTWWLDEAEFAVQRGLLHMEMAEYAEAMPHLDEAAQGRLHRDPYAPVDGGTITAHGEEWGRAAYNDLVHLFLALTYAEAWSDAESIAATVADFTKEVISARSDVMLRRAVRNVLGAQGVDRPSMTLLDLSEDIARTRSWPLLSA